MRRLIALKPSPANGMLVLPSASRGHRRLCQLIAAALVVALMVAAEAWRDGIVAAVCGGPATLPARVSR